MLTFILLGQVSRVASDWWIGSWSANTFHLTTTTYIWIFGVLSVFVGFLIYFKCYFFAKFITTSSQNLQRRLIDVLLKSPLYWFDITPTGRILSRTTKDQDDLDSNLAFNVQMSLQNLLIMFSSILIIGVVTPLYFVFAFVSLLIYYFLIKFYMYTAV
jgi:ATP-binding cassette subfamily C (CFTR/MRP) protein 1